MNKLRRLAVVGLFLSLPFQVEMGAGIRLSPADVFLVFGLIVAVWSLTFRRSFVLLVCGLFPVVIAFGCAVTAVDNAELSRYALFNKLVGSTVLFSVVVFVAGGMRSIDEVRRCILAFVAGAVLSTIIGMAALYGVPAGTLGGFDLVVYQGRLSGAMYDPNAYAVMAGVALILLVSLWQPRWRLWKTVAAVIGSLVLIAGVALSLSRTGWMATAMGAAAYVLLSRDQSRAVRAFVGLTVICGLWAVLIYGPGGVVNAVEMLVAVRSETVAVRIGLMREAWELFTVAPVTGHGLGYWSRTSELIVHNSALWLASEVGIVGAAWYVSFAVAPFVEIRGRLGSSMPQRRELVSGLLATHILMLGASQGFEALYQRQWWAILGLLVIVLGRACSFVGGSQIGRRWRRI